MNRIIRIACLAAVLAGAGLAHAQDFQDGVAAARRGDFELAMQQWRPLAESGDAASQYNLGMLYARGDGVDEDLAEAARWFQKAAEQGQVDAQARLGGMYARGLGVELDYEQAVRWLTRAGEQHHAISQYELGVLYANGSGVAQDREAAYFWFTLAARQGLPSAMRGQIRIRQGMSDAQVGTIELRADDWLQERLGAVPPATGRSGG